MNPRRAGLPLVGRAAEVAVVVAVAGRATATAIEMVTTVSWVSFQS